MSNVYEFKNALWRLLDQDEDLSGLVTRVAWISGAPVVTYPAVILERIGGGGDSHTLGDHYETEMFVTVWAFAHNVQSLPTQILDLIDGIVKDWTGDETVDVSYARRSGFGPQGAAADDALREYKEAATYRFKWVPA